MKKPFLNREQRQEIIDNTFVGAFLNLALKRYILLRDISKSSIFPFCLLNYLFLRKIKTEYKENIK